MNKLFIRAGFVFAALLWSFAALSQTAIEAAVRQYNARPDDPVGRGKPMLFINDVPEYPMFYSLTDVPGGRWSWEEVPRYNLKSFCEIGIKLIQVDIAFDHIWKEDGTIVIDTVQKQMKGILGCLPTGSNLYPIPCQSTEMVAKEVSGREHHLRGYPTNARYRLGNTKDN